MNLVADLNQSRGKGAALFQKRKARSEKWVIDENNVKKQGYPPPIPNYMAVGIPPIYHRYFLIQCILSRSSQRRNHGVNVHHHGRTVTGPVIHLFERHLIHLRCLLCHQHRYKMDQDLEILMRNQKGLVLGLRRVSILLSNSQIYLSINRSITTGKY